MEFHYQFGDETVRVRVEKSGEGYIVTVGAQAFTVSVASPSLHSGDLRRRVQPGELSFTLNGLRRLAFVAADGPRRWVAFDAQPFVLTVPQTGRKARREKVGGHDSLEAQMPGLVRRVQVGLGDKVERGQVLVVMEAMKMEIRVSAPHAGVVEKILVQEGQAVERGQTLVEIGGN